MSNQNHKLQLNTNGTNSHSIPDTKSLSIFLEELNESAERAFGENAQHMIGSLFYAKLPPHLKRSLNLAYLEKGTYDQIVAHLERARTQWLREGWGTVNTHNDGCTSK